VSLLECGGSTPLSFYLSIAFFLYLAAYSPKKESGVEPPHSKKKKPARIDTSIRAGFNRGGIKKSEGKPPRSA